MWGIGIDSAKDTFEFTTYNVAISKVNLISWPYRSKQQQFQDSRLNVAMY